MSENSYVLVKESALQQVFKRFDQLERKIEPLLSASKPPEDDDMITYKDAAQRIQMSVSTIYRLVKYNQLPCYKVGKRVLFRRSEVDQLLVQKVV